MRAALEARLARLTAEGKTILYGALARELQVPVAALTEALEDLMRQDAAAGRPLRAVLCCGRLSGGMPARGFFAAAAALGRRFDGPAAVEAERAALFAAARQG